MGIEIYYDIDTTFGNTDMLYVNVENIQYCVPKNNINISVSYWFNKDFYLKFLERSDNYPEGLVEPIIIFYGESNRSLGKEIKLPTQFKVTGIEEKIIDFDIKEYLNNTFNNIFNNENNISGTSSN